MVKARVPADIARRRPARRSACAQRRAAVAVRQGSRPRDPHRAPRGRRAMADVALRGVTKRFGDTQAVDGLDLAIADGEFVVLLGPTGAGKTTTLRLIAGLERPDGGTICIGGRDVTQARAGGARRRLRLPAILALSASVGLREPRLPAALAGAQDGRRTRSAAASRRSRSWCASTTSWRTARRSFPAARCSASPSAARWCASPSIYLMDEPLSSLDAKLRAELRLELKRIQQELGATMLYVTHDQIEAMTMADRIGILAEGGLVQIGTPREIYTEPAQLSMSRRGSASRRSTSCRRPVARRRVARGHARRSAPAPSISTIEKAANGHADGDGRLDRASRRPEPPACDASKDAS